MKARKKGQPAPVGKSGPVLTDAERGIRQRIADALMEFCGAEQCAPATVHERLAVGWMLLERVPGSRTGATRVRAPSKAWAQKLCNPYSAGSAIPKGDLLVALCARLNVHSEWLFTTHGPKKRGGSVELADAFAAAVTVRCQSVAGAVLELEVDPVGVLEFAIAHVVETFQVDERAAAAARTLRARVGSLSRVATQEPATAAAAEKRRTYLRSEAAALVAAIGAVDPPRRVPVSPPVAYTVAIVPVFGPQPAAAARRR